MTARHVIHGKWRRCARCTHKASVRIRGIDVCWAHYNEELKA